jgi:hypothetical protein
MGEYGSMDNHLRGEAAEASFRLTAESRGWIWKGSSPESDIYDHIDCILERVKKVGSFSIVESMTIDVKALRSYGGIFSCKRLTVEFVNAFGNPGSLFGNVDYFAFELDPYNGTFLVVPQKPLLQLVMGNMCVLNRMKSRTGQNDFYTEIDTSLVLPIGEVWERRKRS